MQAVVYREYGTPDVLEVREIDLPPIDDDEVLVRVHASSINSWDWDLLRGTPWYARIGGLRTPQYCVLGADIAGRVEAVGGDVERFQVGDEVFGDLSASGWAGSLNTRPHVRTPWRTSLTPWPSMRRQRYPRQRCSRFRASETRWRSNVVRRF